MSQNEAFEASVLKTGAWDSVAHITLLTVVDEEFGIKTDLEDAEQLTSFDNLLEHVRGRIEAV
ncbi:MAG: acyl carrier protein [Acidobacteria bacterium]|nr:acyl carrier protein [Acidobacteriota bacterium]